jgi:hypothetical protein
VPEDRGDGVQVAGLGGADQRAGRRSAHRTFVLYSRIFLPYRG